MSNNRSISKLLVIMRNNIHLMDTFGLCFLTGMLLRNGHINKDEHYSLTLYMGDNRPVDKSWCGYWWPKYEVKPRKEWLENQIKLLENTSNHDN